MDMLSRSACHVLACIKWIFVVIEDNIKSLPDAPHVYIPYSGKVWQGECLINLLFGVKKFGKQIDQPKNNFNYYFSLGNCR